MQALLSVIWLSSLLKLHKSVLLLIILCIFSSVFVQNGRRLQQRRPTDGINNECAKKYANVLFKKVVGNVH